MRERTLMARADFGAETGSNQMRGDLAASDAMRHAACSSEIRKKKVSKKVQKKVFYTTRK